MVIPEFPLTRAPQRADFLLLRRVGPRRWHPARVLIGLWRLLPSMALVEFKSQARPFRRGDLLRLHGCARQYHAGHHREVTIASLATVLIVPSPSPALASDLRALNWSMELVSGGYWRIRGCDYPGVIVFLNDVSEAEKDDLIGCFGRRMIDSVESARWLTERGGLPTEVAVARIGGFDRFVAKLVAQIPPEERLAGLTFEEQVLANSDKLLRALSPEFIASLSLSTRRKISRRLARPTRRKAARHTAVTHTELSAEVTRSRGSRLAQKSRRPATALAKVT
jgi:hypothetical protein